MAAYEHHRSGRSEALRGARRLAGARVFARRQAARAARLGGLVGLAALLAAGSTCGHDDDDPFATGPSASYEQNLLKGYVINDWNNERRPHLDELKPMEAPAGLELGADGKYRCEGSEIAIERVVIKDPTEYDAAGQVEVAYVCAEHGSYWYSYEKSGQPLKAVYGPFRMRR